MPAAHPIWRLAFPWRTRMHISSSQVLRRGAQTHARAHHRARTHTTTHSAYGRAAEKRAAAEGRNRSKLHVGRITIDDGATPPVVVTSAEFAPFKGDAEEHGWQVSALPRVIPTLTEGARFADWCALADSDAVRKEDGGQNQPVLSGHGRQRQAD